MSDGTERLLDSPSSTPQEQVAILAELYSKRAVAYDQLWSPVIRPPAERLLVDLPLAQARDVIDVGCGSGALLPLIQARAPLATVLGVDRSEGMLARARAKHSGPLALMDIQELDLPDDSFDVAVLAYVLFHLPDPQRCLEGIRRILRPGGTLGIVTWAAEEAPPANKIWDEQLTAAGARALELPAVDTCDASDTPEKLSALLTAAGYEVVSVRSERIEHRWAADDHYDWHLQSTSRVRLASLPPDAREGCLELVRQRLAGRGDDQYLFRGEVLLALASKVGPPTG